MDSVNYEKEAIEKMEGCGDLHKKIKLVPSDAEERRQQVNHCSECLEAFW